MSDEIEWFAAGIMVILFIIIVPFIFIWALNTLGITNVGYDFWTWLAAAIIIILLASGRTIVSHVSGGD